MATAVETAVGVAGAARPKTSNKVRKRAPKACLSCRARKVRCDVSQRGRPCMNCYLDSETCVVTGRASRLRKSQKPATTLAAPPIGAAAPADKAAAAAAAAAVGGQPQFPLQSGLAAGDDGHSHNTASATGIAAVADTHVYADGLLQLNPNSNTKVNNQQRQQTQMQQHQHQHTPHHGNSHSHNHSHDHPHSHSHTHPQAHQHGSPYSDISSRHETASIKGSPTVTRESEPPQQPHANEALHNSSPMASPGDMDGMPQIHNDQSQQNQQQQQQARQHQSHHNRHSQYNNQQRFNGLNDDLPSHATNNSGYSRNAHANNNGSNNDFLSSSSGVTAGVGGSGPWTAEQGLNISADITYSYYPFLAISNLSGILPQDVNYLELQGCLRVPTRSILDEFVQQYFLHVHPLLPLFNEGDFWELYCQQQQGGGARAGNGSASSTSSSSSSPAGGRMSLLVFQGLLFATCNFVSRNSIRALGFPTIRLARAALYRRAKLLFDFETESSPAAAAQAALLLSFWSPSTNSGTKNPNTAWLCTAIQQAKLAEANHYASLLPPDSRRANSLKRLWWCCIIRDRVMGLGVRRSIQITRAHFDLEANPPLTRADLADEIERSRVYNPGTKSCLIEILVHLVELCVVLTDILTLVFPQDDTPGWSRQMADSDAGRVRQCKIELRRWYKDVALKFPMFGGGNSNSNSSSSSGGGGDSNSGSSPGSNTNGNGGGGGGYHAGAGVARLANGGREFYHDSVILYTNLMYMYYHSSRVALCHHEVLHIAVANAAPGFANGGSKAVPVIYENRYELQDAASGVTECLKELIQLRLARWLPISAVACTALPLFLHILDVKLSTSASAGNNNGKNTSANTPSDMNGGGPDNSTSASSALKQHRLNILIEAMKTYQPQYDGVDWISETIRHIVNLAQLDGPAPGANGGSGGNGGDNGNGGISDWTDILAANPSWYLRLALTMDLALSKNRMPEERDFPVGLRGLFTSGFSSIRNLRLGYNKDGSRINNNNNNDNNVNDGTNRNAINSNANGNANGNVNHAALGNNQYASTNMANVTASTAPVTAPLQSNNGMTIDSSGNMNIHIDGATAAATVATAAAQQTAMPSGLTPGPGIVNMMEDPASAAAAAAMATGGLGVGIPGNGGLGDFSGDYSTAFMLAPHHLAMSMGMAMGMDIDMDLGDMDIGNMDMDMNFPPPSSLITPGMVTQLPSSDEEASPASVSGGTSSSEAGNSPPSQQLLQQQQQQQTMAQRNYLAHHGHQAPHNGSSGAMLNAYTFGDNNNNNNAADGSGSPGTAITDGDDQYDGGRNNNGGNSNAGNKNFNGKNRSKGVPHEAEGDQWIEPAWDDEATELRGGDRDTARALLEAMGENA